MTDRILADAYNIKKLMREAEGLADESMMAFAKLRQAMIAARQNPEVDVNTGQRALIRLSQAEQQAMSMSTNLLRVHEELSGIAKEVARSDDDIPTETTPSAVLDRADTLEMAS